MRSNKKRLNYMKLEYSIIILKTELWLNIDKLSSSTLDFISSNGNPRCCDLYSCYGLYCTFLVGMATLMLGVLKRTLSPNMIELELTYIPVKCGIIYPYIDRFFN